MSRTLPGTTLVFFLVLTNWSLRAEEPLPTISVSGKAEIQVVPDEVLITAAVESRQQVLNDAVTDNDSRIRDVIRFLRESGVADTDIRTETMLIQPVMPPGNNPRQRMSQTAGKDQAKDLLKPIGYEVTRQFGITIKDLSRFEAIYQGLVARGINNVSGVEFRTSELRKHKDEARLRAVRAAREKATAMAGELNATLSGIKSIEEFSQGGFFGRNTMQNVVAAAPAGDSFVAGQIEIDATVDVVFYLGNSRFEQ